MNVFDDFSALLREALESLAANGDLPTDLNLDGVGVEPPRDPAHGDIASNAAMVLAKAAGVKPRDLADKLAAELESKPQVATAEVAGPGFINMRVENKVWLDCLVAILKAGEGYGNSRIGEGRKVNVEYVSTNPTGPLHMGHVRGAVFGDALSNLLAKSGFEVLEEYYINDAGAQIDILARSAHLRYRQALGEDIGEIPEGLYPGDYLIPVGEALAARDGDKWKEAEETEWLDPVRRFATAAMMDLIREDLALLGITQEVFFSELSLHEGGAIDHAITVLEEKGLIYQGVLEPPKGKEPDDWEPREQTLFRATQFGDDLDRPLKKSDGSETYFSADIAYHLNKFERGYKEMIDVWGADHGGYVKRMKAAVAAVSGGEAELDVKICQMVKLLRAGEPVRMSKRAGAFVTLRAVVDEVGRDVVRFIMLTRKNDAPLEFDFAKVTEQSKDNPVFYVQYAHARVSSVFRKAADEVPGLETAMKALSNANLGLLGDDELALVKNMAAWPRLVETAAEAHEPHRVAFFLYDLAAAFHALWNRGNEAPDARFIVPGNSELTLARLALARGVALVIASGLAIMGVEPVEEMR